jgi:hypothetical protein
MTDEVFQKPKIGDVFTDIDNNQFTITNLFEVQGDNWIEYQNSIKQPFFCRTEAFLTRFRPLSNY